jgi:uridylate kinase
VEGIFTADPRKDPAARLIPELTFQDALVNGYEVMDRSAFGLCQTNKLPIVVFNMNIPGNLDRVLQGEPVGTIVQ